MNINPRSSWNARAPKYQRALSTTHNGWFWHWLGKGFPEQASDEQILRSIQRYHMDTKGWSDVAYSFAVGREAEAYELRGWDIAGGHTQGYNNTSMAIVFLIGEGEVPTPEMFRTAYAIMAQRPEITLVRPHREVRSTSCPGDEITSELATPQFKENNMQIPVTDNRNHRAYVERLYSAVLDRAPDQGGLDYWTGGLEDGVFTQLGVLIEFLAVRFAADAAATKAVNTDTKGIDPDVIAEQTYRLFLDDLSALTA